MRKLQETIEHQDDKEMGLNGNRQHTSSLIEKVYKTFSDLSDRRTILNYYLNYQILSLDPDFNPEAEDTKSVKLICHSFELVCYYSIFSRYIRSGEIQ